LQTQQQPDENNAAAIREIASASGPWLHAWYDPMAHLKATSSRIATVDITNDGNYALLVVDDSKRLKVFRGTNLISSHKLLDYASCLSIFYPPSPEQKQQSTTATASLPAVAVGTGCYIYIYRSMRPYYKLTLPSIEINSEELAIWNQARCTELSNEQTLDSLAKLRQTQHIELSFRSMFILSITEREEQLKYIESYKSSELQCNTTITCMNYIHKHDAEPGSVSSLIVGTENSDIVFVEASGTKIVSTMKLPSIATQICVIGVMSVDYRVVISTRSAVIHTIRNGKLLGNHIQLESPICCMSAFKKNILVSCINKTLYAYHIKGNNVKLWSLYFASVITCIEPMAGTQFSGNDNNYFLCGFQNGQVAMYNNNQQIHLLKLDESPITALRFGKYGRESSTLIVLNQAGCLSVKIMSRRVNLQSTKHENQWQQNQAVSIQQEIPLDLPPVTQLYLDQDIREKENAENMHKIWQKEIVKFRLKINHEYIGVLRKGNGPIAKHQSHHEHRNKILLNIQVIGLGPWFTLQIHLKNIGKTQIADIQVLLFYDHEFYMVPNNILKVPLLVPSLSYKFNMKVKCIEPNGNSSAIQVAMIDDSNSNNNKHYPFMNAIVDMPISDLTN